MATPLKEWTDWKYKSFIVSILRGGFRKYPIKYETLKEASVGKRLNPKTKRMSEHFTCNSCKQVFPGKEVQVDHIQPVVDPIKGFLDWEVYIKRLFCGRDNLQVLCSECHDKKTALERGERHGNKKPNNG
jgi:5-methylcytosine-specific restriction endonuclease McrA